MASEMGSVTPKNMDRGAMGTSETFRSHIVLLLHSSKSADEGSRGHQIADMPLTRQTSPNETSKFQPCVDVQKTHDPSLFRLICNAKKTGRGLLGALKNPKLGGCDTYGVLCR